MLQEALKIVLLGPKFMILSNIDPNIFIGGHWTICFFLALRRETISQDEGGVQSRSDDLMGDCAPPHVLRYGLCSWNAFLDI